MAEIREGTVVVPVTLEHARLLDSPADFEQRFGLTLVEGYLAFPEAVAQTLETLRAGTAPQWYSHLIVDTATARVVGLGGFAGPPRDGVVEIGYSVAPSARGRGHATAAARAWIEAARERGVRTVIAHTLAQENPSTAVLRRCGFVQTGETMDPDEGPVWRWELDLTR
ncbi:GNAT family N-acetyltransferase [Nocardia farcinica]|uniref:GNAT family N-acetyltransferase n=1 Tax=Nocardia farcinica TaxID=37329 RepID=UPI001B3C97A1|nr:GNAT family protein [Nocardia farcinica]MBF6540574.1 GNAT family N-acetyltransferase [Nocardia farcinica]